MIQVNNNTLTFLNKTCHLDKICFVLLLANDSIKLRCDAFNIENENIGRMDVKWTICAKIESWEKNIQLSDLYFFKGIVKQYSQ